MQSIYRKVTGLHFSFCHWSLASSDLALTYSNNGRAVFWAIAGHEI
jgi:hypothetical protein